jgi:hypothetical protein
MGAVHVPWAVDEAASSRQIVWRDHVRLLGLIAIARRVLSVLGDAV